MILLGISLSGQAQIPQIAEDVQKNIQFRVDNGNHPSIIVGVISSKGRNFFTYGSKALRKKEAVDENTVYEIGSISKTFTGILLADMVIKKELKLDDPLQSLLPEGVEAPGRNGESIKLVHLANHRSSLPRMPTNFSPANPANPFADYSEAQLFDFLNGYILPRDIGSQYEYSNYAMGLLGYLLAAKKGLTYEALLQEVITKPLGLQNTAVTFSPAMRENLAPGHHNGLEVQNWDLPTLAGAGGIRSTASDMLDYLAANMGLFQTHIG
ncbi:MAG: serine hydrolase domain-containing protein, partial [Bacteroidota bacterium]